ncbi:hypothetical protein M422DRAFT_252836 [Sphaerobolus stellatus SS14]|uniref:Uncharacterized protein n=1 Tax=Sphaerobolus stellatus (strain SS14) TaxID=990650 RepID=A0A0C9VZG4_SPHS4|nr:hypothetical protein M422DRAFT_252836 [Sphaerobolus stellatus SS14]
MTSFIEEKQGPDAGYRYEEESGGGRRLGRHAKIWMLCAFGLVALGVHQCYSFSGGSEHQTDMKFDWDKVIPSPELRWITCAENRECARFEVPMDYTNPSGDKVAIALTRIKAKIPSESKGYRGPILFNPGGPGGPGVELIESIASGKLTWAAKWLSSSLACYIVLRRSDLLQIAKDR